MKKDFCGQDLLKDGLEHHKMQLLIEFKLQSFQVTERHTKILQIKVQENRFIK